MLSRKIQRVARVTVLCPKGALVVDEYYDTTVFMGGERRRVEAMSAAKSVTAALIGAAVRRRTTIWFTLHCCMLCAACCMSAAKSVTARRFALTRGMRHTTWHVRAWHLGSAAQRSTLSTEVSGCICEA